MSLILGEIDEFGRSLAHLVQPGSPVARERRKEIRAVLREAVLAAQAEGDDASMEALARVLDRLREIHRRYVGSSDSQLATRLDRHRDFGAIDDALWTKADFSTTGEQSADALSANLLARIERTLAVLSAKEDPSNKVGRVRQMRPREEIKELVTKRVK